MTQANASHDTAVRLVLTMRLLRLGVWRTARELQEELEEHGHIVTLRTVERDLHRLKNLFGLECKHVPRRTFGWAGNEWRRHARLEEIG